ncbi:MAG: hypothetical protein JJU29_07080 [Verrucomicrobia bacterium]|nr:hypothetical protein [Verrucomicrobiota bacterium]MCH8510781.1 DUF6361 family protein [Kiritimatiellia bacterium]
MSVLIPSGFFWLDTSEAERKRMQELVATFREKGTLDEMGIGTIRDGLADLLFPGTSTIQTRARYFLFVPWMYQELERRKTPSHEIRERARRWEVRIMEALSRSGDLEGLIGRDAGAAVQRMPSNIYWNGLRKWGIARFPGSQAQYHRVLDTAYLKQSRLVSSDDPESYSGSHPGHWDPALPPAPEGFPDTVSFSLRPEDAEYLRNRIMIHSKGTMLAHLVRQNHEPERTPAMWESEYVRDLPSDLQTLLQEAEAFSLWIQGASLLYQWLLAEKTKKVVARERCEELIQDWGEALNTAPEVLQVWQPSSLWRLLDQSGTKIPPRTMSFADLWTQGVRGLAHPVQILESDRLKSLVREREISLKRSASRFVNPRALELWRGDVGPGRLTYRWANVLRHLTDLHKGLNHA